MAATTDRDMGVVAPTGLSQYPKKQTRPTQQPVGMSGQYGPTVMGAPSQGQPGQQVQPTQTLPTTSYDSTGPSALSAFDVPTTQSVGETPVQPTQPGDVTIQSNQPTTPVEGSLTMPTWDEAFQTLSDQFGESQNTLRGVQDYWKRVLTGTDPTTQMLLARQQEASAARDAAARGAQQQSMNQSGLSEAQQLLQEQQLNRQLGGQNLAEQASLSGQVLGRSDSAASNIANLEKGIADMSAKLEQIRQSGELNEEQVKQIEDQLAYKKYQLQLSQTDFTNPESISALYESYATYMGIEPQYDENGNVIVPDGFYQEQIDGRWDAIEGEAGKELSAYIASMRQSWLMDDGTYNYNAMLNDPIFSQKLDEYINAATSGMYDLNTLMQQNPQAVKSIVDQMMALPSDKDREDQLNAIISNPAFQELTPEEQQEVLDLFYQLDYMQQIGGDFKFETLPNGEIIIKDGAGNCLSGCADFNDVGIIDGKDYVIDNNGIGWATFDDQTVQFRKNGNMIEYSTDGASWTDVTGSEYEDFADQMFGVVPGEGDWNLEEWEDLPTDSVDSWPDGAYNEMLDYLGATPSSQWPESFVNSLPNNPAMQELVFDALPEEPMSVNDDDGSKPSDRITFTDPPAQGEIVEFNGMLLRVDGAPEDYQTEDRPYHYGQNIPVTNTITGETMLICGPSDRGDSAVLCDGNGIKVS